MKATLLHDPFLTVGDICDGFVYNELKGGATDASNCQMLCRTHNCAKGNR